MIDLEQQITSSNPLTSDLHSLLSEYEITLLNKNKVFLIIDFINMDIQKLISYSNMNYRDLVQIKKDFVTAVAPKVLTALDYFKDLNDNNRFIASGINNLDQLLINGFTNQIYEICGLPGTGKTQMCLTIAINVANCKKDILYIDTKNDFSINRIIQILKSRKYSQQKMEDILQRIKTKRVFDAHDLLDTLNKLFLDYNKNSPFKVIIIDSLPSIFLLYQGETERMGLLFQMTNLLKQFTIVHYTVVIVVNMMTRLFEVNQHEDSTQLSQNNNTTTNIGLGNYWLTIPSNRFLITNCDKDTNRRKVTLVKSKHLKSGNWCYVHVINCGVV